MERLLKELKKSKKVRNYRIYELSKKSMDLGLYGKELGGPYDPIKYLESISGTLHIEWKNRSVSFVNITREGLNHPAKLLQHAHAISIFDEYGRNFQEPYQITKGSNQFSKDISKRPEDNLSFLVSEVNNLKNFEIKNSIKKHSIGMAIGTSRSKVINSKGLNLEESYTSISIGSDWDMRVFFSLEDRKPIEIEKHYKQLELLSRLYKASKRPLSRKPSLKPKTLLIVSPESTWELFNHFIISNISGSSVANNMSRFRKNDFLAKKYAFDSSITIHTDHTLNLTPGSSNFSSEGVRNKKSYFIKNGKLISPILDLKHAQILKMEASSTLGGPYNTSLFSKRKRRFRLQHFIEKTEEAVFVPYFLGIHTQNSMTGDYSLPIPYALYIRNGEILGCRKAIAVGNIFSDLKKDFLLAKYRLFPRPGICFKSNLIFE